jgi:signal transduction histidine kinase
LRKKELEISTLIEDDVFIYADCEMVNTVIRNLISNAIKFSHRGSSIHISVQKKNQYVEIQIEDNGIGMSEEQVNNLFIAGLSKSLPGTDDEKGTGLGLLMVYEFIQLNKGRINVISELGNGSRFIITFPSLNKKAASNKKLEAAL